MILLRMLSVLLVCLVLVTGLSADPIPVDTAHGTVDKVEKDTLTIRPRGPDGKFAKSLTLKLTGTSKVTTLSSRMQSGKMVLVQRDTDAKDLQAKQPIAVIYATVKDGPVLLSAVVQPEQ